MAAKINYGVGFDADYARQIALQMQITRGGKAGAVKHVQETLGNWTGDTRRDGDTPKAFWESVLVELNR